MIAEGAELIGWRVRTEPGCFRCICADLRNANPGQSSGPLEIDRPWDAYTDDQLGLMDHLGIREFMVMGFWARLRKVSVI